MKIQLHMDEQSYVVLTDPSRIKAQLESQPVSRLLRVLEGVIQALYLTGRWDAASCDKVAYALKPLLEVNNLDPHMDNKLTPDELRSQLRYFTGTESYTRYSPLLFPNVLLTDGTKFLAKNADAYWLMDMIASHLPSVPEDEYFAVAKLTLDVIGGADFRLEDGNDKLYANQRIEYTSFPLPEGVTLYAQTDGKQWIIMLTSEY